jgi:hypothetical protein
LSADLDGLLTVGRRIDFMLIVLHSMTCLILNQEECNTNKYRDKLTPKLMKSDCRDIMHNIDTNLNYFDVDKNNSWGVYNTNKISSSTRGI